MGKDALVDALKILLHGGKANTQDELCKALQAQGFEINQTKISRLLRKIGAVKLVTPTGQVAYSLPREPSPPTLDTSIGHLIMGIVENETMIVIFTSPGSASMVARLLDYQQLSFGILGTIAGDDTIFVTPKSIKETAAVAKKIKSLLLA